MKNEYIDLFLILQILPCEKNRLCSKYTNLYRTPLRFPARKSIFQYPAYFGLLAEIHISISISCRASYYFFFQCRLLQLVIRYIGPDKTHMHRLHPRCGPHITTCFLLHVCRIVPALTHLASHPYFYLPPFSFGKKKRKKSIVPRFSIFPSPRFGSYCLFGKIQRVPAFN